MKASVEDGRELWVPSWEKQKIRRTITSADALARFPHPYTALETAFGNRAELSFGDQALNAYGISLSLAGESTFVGDGTGIEACLAQIEAHLSGRESPGVGDVDNWGETFIDNVCAISWEDGLPDIHYHAHSQGGWVNHDLVLSQRGPLIRVQGPKFTEGYRYLQTIPFSVEQIGFLAEQHLLRADYKPDIPLLTFDVDW